MQKTRKEPIRLTYSDGQVVVTPEDRDIFLISAEQAIEARREPVREDERIASFEAKLLLPLHAWCVKHENDVAACYIPLPAGSIKIFIVTAQSQFNFSLSDEMASLERDLARAGWRIGVTQLPHAEKRSLTAFFDPHGALEVFANASESKSAA